MTAIEMLTQINLDIGAAEEAGNKEFFADLFAPAFAMRRANGTVVDRGQFLEGVAKSDPRPTVVKGVMLIGDTRALVTCRVDMGGVKYDNLRLFTRDDDDHWMLLAWANERES